MPPAQGRPSKLTYPSGREAEYTYDDRQLLKTIKWETTQIEDRSYNDAGMLTGVDRAYVDETRTYNAGSQLTQIDNTSVGSQTYTYDLNGNVTSETLSGVMANYSFSTLHSGSPYADGYDAEDRFMRFKRSGVSEDILLTRSDIGNISNVNRNGTNTARGYNTSHGLTTVTGGTTQTYDTDGNTTKLHTNVTAAWDDAGRMKNTDVPSGASAGIEGLNENGYVGGTRIWKKITRNGKGGPSVVEHRVHIHAGPNLIAEYNAGVAASTPVQEYVYAGEIDSLVLIRRSDATKYGVTRNRQWSITALHDMANGDVVERYAYEMTGKRTIYAANGTTVRTTSSYGNNFGYTNRWHDEESGLMYFRARYYNPLTGEFLSRDPMEFVDGMSLYRGYFFLMKIDPSGRCSTMADKGKYSFCQTVVQKPSRLEDSPCGGATAEMKWEIVEAVGQGGVPADVDGYIIQKVEIEYNTKDCNDKLFFADDDGSPLTICFYEAWQVRKGIVYAWGIKDSSDTFHFPPADYKTKGSYTISAEVAFVKDFVLERPLWRAFADPGHMKIAKRLPTLPCTLGPPDGWEQVRKYKRTMRIEWDCCCDPIEETEISMSGWESMCMWPGIEYEKQDD